MGQPTVARTRPIVAAHEPVRTRTNPLRNLGWPLLAIFLAYQVGAAVAGVNGPFLDEGIYITAGLRTWEGHGISDGYLGWFAGSLLWPAIAGLGFLAGGLAGAKIVAGLFVTLGLGAAMRATTIWYGPSAGRWGFAISAVAAPVLALGHLAVYDVLAVAGFGLCLLALAELTRTDHRGWLVLVALAFGLAVLGKYPAAFLTPVLVALLFALRGRRAVVDLALAGVLISAVLLAFYLPFRFQLAWFVEWRAGNNPSYGVTRDMVVYEQVLYNGLFVALAAVGVAVARGSRVVALCCGSALLIFPAYHVLTANSISALKHVTFGIVLAMPAVGRGLSAIAGTAWWRRGIAGLLVGTYLVVGLTQVHRLDRGWVDARPGAAYLAAHMRPGDSLVVPNAWQIIPYLYGTTVDDPNAVPDAYDLLNAKEPIDLCATDWIVNTVNDNAWPDDVMARIEACGTFEEVFRSGSELTNMGADFRYVTYQGAFVIYQNTGPAA